MLSARWADAPAAEQDERYDPRARAGLGRLELFDDQGQPYYTGWFTVAAYPAAVAELVEANELQLEAVPPVLVM